MILAFCCSNEETGPEAILDERFGRCGFFLFYNTEDRSYRCMENSAAHAAGGAGVRAVQIIADQGASVLLAPEVGPQGMDALANMGVKAFRQGKHRTAGAVLHAWQNRTLDPQEKLNKMTRV